MRCVDVGSYTTCSSSANPASHLSIANRISHHRHIHIGPALYLTVDVAISIIVGCNSVMEVCVLGGRLGVGEATLNAAIDKGHRGDHRRCEPHGCPI